MKIKIYICFITSILWTLNISFYNMGSINLGFALAVESPSFKTTRAPRLPTFTQTSHPSSLPSSEPSSKPTSRPSPFPSPRPTSIPTSIPTPNPSTSNPSSIPTVRPTPKPSTRKPTRKPSRQPFSRTRRPSRNPSRVPTDVPTFNPSNPSISPSFSPSVKSTLKPSKTPIFLPTLHPSFNSTTRLNISVIQSLSGITAKTFTNSSATENCFIKTVSQTVVGLSPSDISITNVRDLVPSKILLTQFSREMSTSSIGVSYIISVIIQSLGFTNTVAANNYITSVLRTSIKNENFTKLLQYNAIQYKQPALANVVATGVIFVTPSIPSLSPTLQPITPETPGANTINESGYSSWPLYGQVLLPIAVILFFCAFALLFLQFYSSLLPFGKKSNSNNNNNSRNETSTTSESLRRDQTNNFSDLSNKTEIVIGSKVTENPITFTPNNAYDSSMIDDEEDEKVNESEEMSRAEGNTNPLIMSTPKTITSISTPNSKYSIKKSDTMSRASGRKSSRLKTPNKDYFRSPMAKMDSIYTPKVDFTSGDFQP